METVCFGRSIKGIAWPRFPNAFLLRLLRNIFGGMLSFHVSCKNTCQMCLYVFEKCKTKLEKFHGVPLYDTCLKVFFKKKLVPKSHRHIKQEQNLKGFILFKNLCE